MRWAPTRRQAVLPVTRSAARAGLAALAALAAALMLPPARAQQPAAPAPAASSPVAAPGAPTQHADALNLVAVWLEAQAAFERVPGLSAGVVVDQQLVWRQAWGRADHAGRVPAAPDTLYSICSISKLFTSIAVMQLWEQGRLTLDEDIGRWLPAFAIQRSDPDSGPITVRGLLTHSSGLPREGVGGYWAPPDFVFPTREQLLQGLATQRTMMRAGDHYQYSNLGMAVLGELVTAVSGQPYDDYVAARILAPLGLADTRPVLPAALWGGRLAQGHGALRRDGTRQTLPLFDARAMGPAAGYSSTVDDLARFASWQFRLRARGGQEVLKVSTLREMQRVHWTDPDGRTTWGLGFGISREGTNTVVGHTGICPGYLAALSLALEPAVAVVAMVNANDNRSAGRYTRAMRQIMLKGLKLPVAPATGPDLKAYAGRYGAQPWASESVIVAWGTGLAALDLPNNDPAAEMELLQHVAGDTFRFQRADGTPGSEIAFVRDGAGRVTGYRMSGMLVPRLP